MDYPNLSYRTPTPPCEDIQRKLRETGQIYLPEIDMPLSITRNLFDLLDAKRKVLAKARGVPEIQYDFEDLLFELWRKDPDTMFFNVPEARQQLISKGLVYTLRPKVRRTGKDVAYHGSYYKKEKIGDVQVDFIRQITTPYELKEYVGDSGFEKVEDWWEAAEGSQFLFKVRKV